MLSFGNDIMFFESDENGSWIGGIDARRTELRRWAIEKDGQICSQLEECWLAAISK